MEKCVICETMGNDVDADTKVEFNGDMIPCCYFHKDLVESGLFFSEDEESD